MAKKRYEPELTDLKAITRNSDRCLTRIFISDKYGMNQREWLRFGQCQMDDHDRKKTTTIKAYLLNATDFEHDSAYALQLPVVGLYFDSLFYHTVTFGAWVAPDAGPDKDGRWASFHVPRPGYDPQQHEESKECSDCHCDRHIIVPEEFYVPPFDNELYQAVRGCRVEIRVGPAEKEDKDAG